MGGCCRCNQTNEKADVKIRKTVLVSPDKSCSRDTGGKKSANVDQASKAKINLFFKKSYCCSLLLFLNSKLLPSCYLWESHNLLFAKLSKPLFDPLVLASFTHCSEQFKVDIMLFDQYNQLISKVYRWCLIKFSLVVFFTEKSRCWPTFAKLMDS